MKTEGFLCLFVCLFFKVHWEEAHIWDEATTLCCTENAWILVVCEPWHQCCIGFARLQRLITHLWAYCAWAHHTYMVSSRWILCITLYWYHYSSYPVLFAITVSDPSTHPRIPHPRYIHVWCFKNNIACRPALKLKLCGHHQRTHNIHKGDKSTEHQELGMLVNWCQSFQWLPLFSSSAHVLTLLQQCWEPGYLTT